MAPPRAKVPPYLMLLLVSFALLGIIGYQTLKNRTVSADLLKQKDTAIHRLEERLQKEEKRISELQKKLAKLSSQKDELNGMREGLSRQLIELGRVKSLTEDDKRKLESTLKATEEEIKDLKDKLALFDKREEELKLIKVEMGQKNAEILELRAQLKAGVGSGPPENRDLSSESSEQASKTREESNAMRQMGLEEGVGSEKGRVVTEEKDMADGSHDVGGLNDDGTENVKEEGHESKEGGSRVGKQQMEEPTKASSLDGDKTEPQVDDKDTKANDKEEEEEEEEEAHKAHEKVAVDDTKKGHKEEVDDGVGEKAHEEEEQPDSDMEVVNKAADHEETEMAATE